jgi:hypothetical protein
MVRQLNAKTLECIRQGSTPVVENFEANLQSKAEIQTETLAAPKAAFVLNEVADLHFDVRIRSLLSSGKRGKAGGRWPRSRWRTA